MQETFRNKHLDEMGLEMISYALMQSKLEKSAAHKKNRLLTKKGHFLTQELQEFIYSQIYVDVQWPIAKWTQYACFYEDSSNEYYSIICYLF
jgi:hypothetical protein